MRKSGAAAAAVGLVWALGAAAGGCKASVDVKANAALNDDDDGSDGDGQPVSAPPAIDITPPPGPPTATYPGFRVLPDGSSLVRVEVSRVVAVEAKESANVIVYRLKGTRAPERVNRLPLISQHFSTRISQVTLQQAGEDLDVVIELREGAKSQHKVIESEGQMILEILVPPWSHGTVASTGTSAEDDD